MQLGRWTHASTLPDNEDILADPNSCPFTPEVHAILSPHQEILTALIESDEPPDVPVTRAIHDGSLDKLLLAPLRGRGFVPFTGGLDTMLLAQISNWISCNIPGASEHFVEWMQRAPFAHAITLFLAAQKHGKFSREFAKAKSTSNKQTKQDYILDAAWRYQCITTNPNEGDVVDVDRECISILEEYLFTRSKAAGLAGCYQWGLDAGDHQNRWNPYVDLPFHWAHDDVPEYDEELFAVRSSYCHTCKDIAYHFAQRGPNYVEEPEPIPEPESTVPRPKPRQKQRIPHWQAKS